jgi:hypothetical protein
VIAIAWVCSLAHLWRQDFAYAALMGSVMLHEFVTAHREELISRCSMKVPARSTPPPTKPRIDHGVPMFLGELVDELRLGLSPRPTIRDTATRHGRDLLRQGFTVSQVVHEYGDVCQAITGMAVELNVPISTDDFRVLNRCLDDAIAAAVTEYGRERDRGIHGEMAGETERLGVLARDVRNAIYTAADALEAIKSGSVGLAGSTGTVLNRSLVSARDLIDCLLAENSAGPRRHTDPVM